MPRESGSGSSIAYSVTTDLGQVTAPSNTRTQFKTLVLKADTVLGLTEITETQRAVENH